MSHQEIRFIQITGASDSLLYALDMVGRVWMSRAIVGVEGKRKWTMLESPIEMRRDRTVDPEQVIREMS